MKKRDRFEQALREPPMLIRQRDAIRAVQSEGILRRLVYAGWLTPVVREPKYVTFRRSDVERVVERILSGEMPPQIPRIKKVSPLPAASEVLS